MTILDDLAARVPEVKTLLTHIKMARRYWPNRRVACPPDREINIRLDHVVAALTACAEELRKAEAEAEQLKWMLDTYLSFALDAWTQDEWVGMSKDEIVADLVRRYHSREEPK